MGSLFRSKGRLEEALAALREARQLAEGPLPSDPVQRALNLYGILLREARALGQDCGVSWEGPTRRSRCTGKRVDLMEELLLRATKDYPAQTIKPEGSVAIMLRAQADCESLAGDRRRAVEIYEQLWTAMMVSKPDPLGDLLDASKVSMMYSYMSLPARGRYGQGCRTG